MDEPGEPGEPRPRADSHDEELILLGVTQFLQELEPLNIAVRYITRVLQSDDYACASALSCSLKLLPSSDGVAGLGREDSWTEVKGLQTDHAKAHTGKVSDSMHFGPFCRSETSFPGSFHGVFREKEVCDLLQLWQEGPILSIYIYIDYITFILSI